MSNMAEVISAQKKALIIELIRSTINLHCFFLNEKIKGIVINVIKITYLNSLN